MTQTGTLTQASPVVVSADDLKVMGFIAAAIVFVLVQYALIMRPLRHSTHPRKPGVQAEQLLADA